jgi:hypothetical protein
LIAGGIGALVFGAFCAGFGALGDWFVEYTVVNDTDVPLITRHMNHDCSRIAGYRYSYTPTKIVLPHQRLEYHASRGRFTGGCIQVATTDRRLVQAVEYSSRVVVVVPEDAVPGSVLLPDPKDLPRRPSNWLDIFTTNSPLTIFGLVVSLGGVLSLLVGLMVAGIHLVRRSFGQRW